MARGGKTQGYNAQLDESLAMRKGAKRTKQQSDKDRRDEAKAMNKAMGRRAYASVRGMDKGRRMMAKGGRYDKYLGVEEFDEKRHQEARDWMKEMEKKYSDIKFKKLSLDDWLYDYKDKISKSDYREGYILAYGDVYPYAKGGSVGEKIYVSDSDYIEFITARADNWI